MGKRLRNRQLLCLALAAFFCLSTALISAHAHAKATEEPSHHCAVCQYSHSGPQGLFNPQQPHAIDLTPLFYTPSLESHPEFSDPQEIPTIRGPPLAS